METDQERNTENGDSVQVCTVNNLSTPIWDPIVPDFPPHYTHLLVKGRSEVSMDILAYVGHLQGQHLEKYKFREIWGYDKDDDGDYYIRFRPPKGHWQIPFEDKVIDIVIAYRVDTVVHQRDGPCMYYEIHLFSEQDFALLNRFIEEARKYANPSASEDKIVCKRYASGTYWLTFAKHYKRDLKTLFLVEGLQQEIVQDLEAFISTEKEYRDFGMPYKKVYLLSGLPGTGKTSLVYALASHFNFDLYVFPFDKYASDNALNHAVASLDNKSILLLEDIEQGVNRPDKISLNGITNILDGVNHKDRMIVFMTTNSVEKLSDIITRPGRVDKHIKFNYATPYQIETMLCHYFPQQCQVDTVVLQKVVEKLSAQEITTAAFADFLFRHRKSPDILKQVEKDIEEIVKKTWRPENVSYFM